MSLHAYGSLRAVFVLSIAASALSYGANGASVASTDSTCLRAFRTLGSEWEVQPHKLDTSDEFGPVDSMIARGFFPDAEYFTPSLDILSRSNFPKLFSFWGLDSHGRTIENFIPKKVADSAQFKELLHKTPSLKIEVREDGVIIKNYSSLRANDFSRLIEKVLEGRGRDASSLYLAKSSEGWANSNHLDQLIDNKVHEEWRGEDQMIGLEFVMKGGVESARDIKGWYSNLWSRLGTLPELPNGQDPLKLDRNHIHWRMHVPVSVSKSEKTALYDGFKGFWGDSNDATYIASASGWTSKVAPATGELKLDRSAGYEVPPFEIVAENYSIAPLTREMYLRVQAGDQGISVRNAQKEVDPAIDPAFPPLFKRLNMGLRSPKEKSPDNAHLTVATPELEARTLGENTRENLERLPKVEEGTPFVDEGYLKQFQNSGARGLIGDVSMLRFLASDKSLDPNAVTLAAGKIHEFAQRNQPYCWSEQQMMGAIFIPLNNWLSHPLAERTLQSMPTAERSAFVKRYDLAVGRYVDRVRNLHRAASDPNYIYRPDWLAPPHKLLDGKNRFFRRGQAGYMPGLDEHEMELSYSTDLYRWGLWMEMHRFVAEANLQTVIQIPK